MWALRRVACKLRPGEREGPEVGLEEATGGARLEKEKAPPQGVAGRATGLELLCSGELARRKWGPDGPSQEPK